MKEVYQEVKKEVPYNSAGKILLAENISYPEQLGGNCVFQTKRLAEGLREQGYDPGFIFSSDHMATVCEVEGKVYFMDPSLMHREPIVLDDIFAKKDVYLCESFPLLNGESWRLAFVKKNKDRFGVNLIREETDGSFVIIQTYEYDLGKVSNSLPDVADRRIAFAVDRKVLSMNCERDDGTVSRVVYHIKKKIMGIARFGNPDAYKNDNRVKTAIELRDLALELGVSLQEMIEVFKTAAEIYERVQAVREGDGVAA